MDRSERQRALGAWGERRAEVYLESEGWSVLERNWRASRGEVDLIMYREEPGYAPEEVRRVVAFVEVKTRMVQQAINRPECSVTKTKRAQLVKLALMWQQAHDRASTCTIRFDVVGVLRARDGRLYELKHIEGAFDARGACT